MKYNFDEVVDRHNSLSVKWDLCKDPEVIPMWVADMDFKAAPFIMDAVRSRVEHGVFGYTQVPDSYYKAVCDWFQRRRGWKIEPEWIQYICGIVPAISVGIEALSEPGDNVLFSAPAYNCFYSSVRNSGRSLLENKLVATDSEDGMVHFSIDFDDFEAKCADPRTSLFILCNPHNPTGRIWTREELTRMGEICLRNGVTVISDEIHCELEMPGFRYIPFASISKEFQHNCVTFCSPSKSFNIAGLEIANIVSEDPEKRARIDHVINVWEHCDVNPLGVAALPAAYSPDGEEWLKQLNTYLADNFQMLCDAVKKDLPGFRLSRLEGTYLAWLECGPLIEHGISTKEAQDSMTATEKVWINSGTMYGDGNWMRINLACPHSTMEEGLRRMVKGLRRLSALD